jgi:hypothetical protein
MFVLMAPSAGLRYLGLFNGDKTQQGKNKEFSASLTKTLKTRLEKCNLKEI